MSIAIKCRVSGVEGTPCFASLSACHLLRCLFFVEFFCSSTKVTSSFEFSYLQKKTVRDFDVVIHQMTQQSSFGIRNSDFGFRNFENRKVRSDGAATWHKQRPSPSLHFPILSCRLARFIRQEWSECCDYRDQPGIDKILNHILDLFVGRGSFFVKQVAFFADHPAT